MNIPENSALSKIKWGPATQTLHPWKLENRAVEMYYLGRL